MLVSNAYAYEKPEFIRKSLIPFIGEGLVLSEVILLPYWLLKENLIFGTGQQT